LVCGFRALILEGLRKLRPRVELQRLQGRKVRTLATEQKRNVHPASDDDTYQIVEDAGRETVKRPSCKWKGQTDADEDSARSAGSPISRMPQSTKGGLRPTRQLYSSVCRPLLFLTKIFKVLWEMKKALRKSMLRNTRKALSFLGRTVDLDMGEDVKGFIARIDKNESNKHSLSILITIMPSSQHLLDQTKVLCLWQTAEDSF